MKKRFYLLFAALFAVSSFALVSCSNDDDDDDVSGSIVGTWKTVAVDGLGSNIVDLLEGSGSLATYAQFKEDGTFIEIYIDGSDVEIENGQWVLSGNKLTTSGSNYITTTVTITELTDSYLTFTYSGTNISISHERVDDSEIEQYLD